MRGLAKPAVSLCKETLPYMESGCLPVDSVKKAVNISVSGSDVRLYNALVFRPQCTENALHLH
jgi:hypothetical protein